MMKLHDVKISNYNSMVELYHSETDRGAAVLAGSYVENVLGKYLIFQMEDKTLSDELFASNGPLSTFSQRIAISRAFGYISSNEASTLNYIRKIRNYFAHHPFDASFNESPVREWITQLLKLFNLACNTEYTASNNKDNNLEVSRRNLYLISCGYFSTSIYSKMGLAMEGA